MENTIARANALSVIVLFSRQRATVCAVHVAFPQAAFASAIAQQ